MDEIREYVKLRGMIYKILAYGFYMEPDADYIADQKRSLPIFEIINKGFPSKLIEEGIELFGKFIKIAEADMEKAVSDYERHFALVFLSTGFPEGKKSIVPHESVYLSAKGWSMQEHRDEVLEYFYNQGIGKDQDFKEPEDHISAEMNFMSLLSRQTYDAMNENDEQLAMSKLEIQLDFLKKHLMKWLHKVCNDLYGMEDFILYKSIARLTAGFVEMDYQFLSEVVRKETRSLY